MTSILLGLAGLVPFVACGIGALSADPIQNARMMAALLAYGAVILSFLGGVHWGFALSPALGVSAAVNRARLVLGVLPCLAGWAALLIGVNLAPWAGLALLGCAFAAVVLVEAQAARRNLLPPRYMALRWGLTAAVIAILLIVLGLRLIGAHAAI